MKTIFWAVVPFFVLVIEAPAQDPIRGGTRTPDCVSGTQRPTQTSGLLLLSPAQYCADPKNVVRDVRRNGSKISWRVPLVNGSVDCECTSKADR